MGGKATMDEDLAAEGLVQLLRTAGTEPEARSAALEALASATVWLATWEPHAEGFRTLINGDGEEALAAFTSEAALREAADRFDWLDEDGAVTTHEARGAEILRHAWTREYAFVIVDIAAPHSVEYDRDAIRATLRDVDITGPFRTSRPPATGEIEATTSSFPPPVEPISTTYSMTPSHEEVMERLSELPTKPHVIPVETEPPTRPLPKINTISIDAKSIETPLRVQEIVVDSARIEVAGVAPRTDEDPRIEPPQLGDSVTPDPSLAGLQSDVPTAPGGRQSDLVAGAKVNLPPIAAIGLPSLEPPPIEPTTESLPPTFVSDDLGGEESDGEMDSGLVLGDGPALAKVHSDESADGTPASARHETPARRVPAMSIGDSIELTQLLHPPSETLLASLTGVLRQYPEVEWASYCEVARPAGSPSPAVCLRVDENYRDNVTAMIKELCEAGRTQDIEVDVLLMDGHDLLRKARERAFVFFPWKPKPFGS